MGLQVKCPECGHYQPVSGHTSCESNGLMSVFECCDKCGEYYEVYFKVQLLGTTTHGCNMFPAPGVTEEEMYAAGVRLDD